MRTRFLFRIVGAGIVLAIAGVGALHDRFFPDDASNGNPAEWPAEVAPIAAFVETERTLDFDHPVLVDFLSEDEYVELFSSDSYTPTSEDRIELDRLSRLYDAAGLAVGFDVFEGESTVTSIGTLGLYIPAEDRIYVRGSELTPAVRAVLAHELTHALQAQHFELELGGADDLSVRSIVEADALRVENAYLETLPEADRIAATVANTIDDATTDALSAVPEALVEATSAPYVLGPLLVDSVYGRDGNEGVNRLLRQAPTEEILVNPRLFNTGETDAAPEVELPAGAEVIEDIEQLSILDTLLMLDAWLPWTQARGAVDGWNGGGYVSYVRSDGLVCFRMNASFDATPAPFAAAIVAWADASGSTAVPNVVDGRVIFEACERGAGALAPPPAVVSSTAALYLEQLIVDGVPPESVEAWQCFARGMIDDPSAAPILMKQETTPDDDAVIAWVRNSVADACGVASG